MATYEVLVDFYLQEQDIQLEAGLLFFDGELDPDVIAQLLSSEIIAEVEGENED